MDPMAVRWGGFLRRAMGFFLCDLRAFARNLEYFVLESVRAEEKYSRKGAKIAKNEIADGVHFDAAAIPR